MGCVSSTLLNTNNNEDFSTTLSHHIVSLTSTTYGLLSLDPSPPTTSPPPPRFTIGSIFSEPRSHRSEPEIINSWELMAGLDSVDSFRFSPILTTQKPSFGTTQCGYADKEDLSPVFAEKLNLKTTPNRNRSDSFNRVGIEELQTGLADKKNLNPNFLISARNEDLRVLKTLNGTTPNHPGPNCFNRVGSEESQTVLLTDKENLNTNCLISTRNEDLGLFKTTNGTNPNHPRSKLLKVSEKIGTLCPPNGENRVVIYTTTLRGVRKTYEACNAVRAVIHNLGFALCERDVSMDRGLRDELRVLMNSRDALMVLPQVFVRGRYVGGADEVLRLHEEGSLIELLRGLPKVKFGHVCDGCGGVRFLPCFSCNGSCKMVTENVVVRCLDCNENGLVLCPICS